MCSGSTACETSDAIRRLDATYYQAELTLAAIFRARWQVEAHRLGCDVGKDDAGRVDAARSCLGVDVALAIGREAQQPQHAATTQAIS